MNLSACIVTYNDCEEALRAAASVLEHTRRHPLTLYLVDNASPDDAPATSFTRPSRMASWPPATARRSG